MRPRSRSFAALSIALLVALVPCLVGATGGPFLTQFSTDTQVSSTVPANGDVNPYGVAVVPTTTGKLVKDNVLVSNFNNAANQQGTGTTIVQISPSGKQTVFAQIDASKLPGPCPGGVGLTTALVVLSRGWVIVGSLPTSDGTAATAQAGCLLVLNNQGTVVQTISGGVINGPWDMTVIDKGNLAYLFVTNVLNGTVAANGGRVNKGTIVRILLALPDALKPIEISRSVIASGFGERTDPAALVIGPTGLGVGKDGTLYVADTLDNRIAAIPNAYFTPFNAGTGKTVSIGGEINGPLGLAVAPNGDIIVANGGDGNLVEVTPGGAQVATHDTGLGAGALFGLAIAPLGRGVYYVDDVDNTLNLLH